MSEITFIGNLVAEPEIRYTKDNKPWASFTLVKSDRVKQGDQWVDGDPTFFDCVTFEYGAENLKGVEKGARLIVSGVVKQQNWETQDGQKRSKLQINVKEVGVSTRFNVVAVTRTGSGGSKPSSGYGSQGGAFNGSQNDGWANPGQSFGDPNSAPF